MQQQGGGGGSQFGQQPGEMAPFSPTAAGPRPPHLLGVAGSDQGLQQPPQLAEAAPPISTRPPPAVNFDELMAPAVAGNFPDDDALAAGEDAEPVLGGGAASGNRWPRQETLALLKIRSEMDAAFRDATLKGPLWDEVSRKLAELGYKRNAKKCKEKFENVHKYYKRTKDGRAGRQDGKSYRFFSQLEALHSGGATATATGAVHAPSPSSAVVVPASSAFMAGPPPSRAQPLSAVAPPTMAMPTRAVAPELTAAPGVPQGISSSAAAIAGFSFSSNSSASSSSESDDEVTEEAGGGQEGGRKRKHGGGGTSGTSRKMMAFFDRLTKQVMERQEAMQQRFLEAIEKREQDRMIRDEAWRRQEMARLSREQELLAQERAMAASRDTAIISYLQKISGQTNIPIPTMAATPISVAPAPLHSQHPSHPTAPPPPSVPPQQQQAPPAPPAQPSPRQQHQPSSAAVVVPDLETHEPMSSSSSRWPKTEVHALIKIRSDLESKFHETGPKGPLWEEISAGMQRIGYSRSAKRCKEKWENINKYFKKVKESNKRRPEDSKTCPYYHQLDALYRKKHGAGSSSSTAGIQQHQPPQPPDHQQPATEAESKNAKSSINNNGDDGEFEGAGDSGSAQIQTSNGGLPPSFFDAGLKKPEDIVKELMGEEPQEQAVMDDYDKLDEPDSDNLEDDDDEDDEAGKLQYEIQFQRQNGGGNSAAAATTADSFLAMA
ncbi:trihelix transcription factor GTL1-like isoform X1 [Canna indica]|uniref:Trihelix transcription factor GTL1-like isoform X1 n=1 Tax=Canna indica TaxID=4628 RepID=A0AAQ3QEQ8_9LILI|nr:trihelix transcription factor GTL1-like isoform X1 [Canna indica]